MQRARSVSIDVDGRGLCRAVQHKQMANDEKRTESHSPHDQPPEFLDSPEALMCVSHHTKTAVPTEATADEHHAWTGSIQSIASISAPLARNTEIRTHDEVVTPKGFSGQTRNDHVVADPGVSPQTSDGR